jgi:hypothetical protein
MSLVRFEVEGTKDEVIAEVKGLMTPGRYSVRVSRVPGESECWYDDEIVPKSSVFDAPVEARERAAAAEADGKRPGP